VSTPGVADRDSAEWWEALERHELVVQRCHDCGVVRWPPRALCARCGSVEWSWSKATGRGTVASWIVNHHTFGSSFESPYVVLMVRLDDADDILMPGAWAGARDGRDLAAGAHVDASFDRAPDGTPRVVWTRSDRG